MRKGAIDNPFFGDRETNAINLYYILSILIFETGSAFPNKIKEEVLNNKFDWMDNKDVDELRERVRNHVPGKPLKKKILELRDKI